ncbi:MAG: tetratricopeptide repeat protein [Akkermansiaceae bacterium]|nr:tetratricopeptide repeat protein [Akkermansiaceae bacterium]
MHRLLITILVFCSLHCQLPAESTAEQDYYSARKLAAKGDKKAAYELFMSSVAKARQKNNIKFEFYAHYHATYVAYSLQDYDKTSKCAENALKCLENNQNQRWSRQRNIQSIKVEVLGLAERCASIQQKITTGWALNHKAITAWKKLANHPSGSLNLDPALVAKSSADLRSLGWRLIEREASYLQLVGRTPEARSMLNSAIKHIGTDPNSSHSTLSAYSIKLITHLALIESFVGYKQRAIELYEQSIRVSQANKNYPRISLFGQKLNLYATIAYLQGVDDKIIADTDSIIAESEQKKYRNLLGLKRHALRIKSTQNNSQIRQSVLEQLAIQNNKVGNQTEVLFTSRDALFEQAKCGKAGLDKAFNQFVTQVRRSGNKKAEPRIYRVYGDWLRIQHRHGEALTVYQEALRLNQNFEWHPMTILVMAKMGAAYLESNQPDAAWEIWKRMEAFQQLHPDLPGYTIVRSRSIQIHALLRAGLEDKARALATSTLQMAKAMRVPNIWLTSIQLKFLDQLLLKLKKSEAPQPNSQKENTRPLIIHPVAMNTLSLPTGTTRASFFLINRESTGLTGKVVVTGNGVSFVIPDGETIPSVRFDPNLPKKTIEHRIRIESGRMVEIRFASSKPLSGQDNRQFSLTWQSDNRQEPPQEAKWGIFHSITEQNYAVLDSAQCTPTPFIGVPVLHHIHFPETAENPVGFRMRSKIPLRLEYRKAGTGKLLAVDDNGNGIFTDGGDFISPQKPNITNQDFPVISPEKNMQFAEIEIWIFTKLDTNLDKDVQLPLEIHHTGKGWTEYARDVIRGN